MEGREEVGQFAVWEARANGEKERTVVIGLLLSFDGLLLLRLDGSTSRSLTTRGGSGCWRKETQISNRD
jgi:hypothetical protein